MTNTLLKLDGITKEYQDFTLGPIDFALATGETCAIIGKNGAGKTTLFQIMTGNTDATDGELFLASQRLLPDSFQLKRSIGYLPQHLDLPRWITGQELLEYACRLYKLDDPTRIIEQNLTYWDALGYRHRPLAACSHGMQKRVALALSTLHDPTLLILDEPFSGLDLYHIKALEEKISSRREAGKSTIICTHIALNAARLCQRAIIVNQGKLQEITTWQTSDTLARIASIENYFFGQ